MIIHCQLSPRSYDYQVKKTKASSISLDSRLRDCVAMSLRSNEVTEAISLLPENKEIAAPPAGARNDETVMATQFDPFLSLVLVLVLVP